MKTLGALLVLVLVAGLAPAQDKVSFEKEVLPILENSCHRCHKGADPGKKGSKAKGGLRLDGKGWILAGSNSGKVVVPGKPGDSLLYALTVLPAGHEDLMPSKGRLLTNGETTTIREWINGGADFGTWTGKPGPGTASTPFEGPVVSAAAANAKAPSRVRMLEALAKGAPRPSAAVIAKARALGQIEPIAPGSPLLRVAFRGGQENIGDSELASLAPLFGNIAYLDLSRTAVTDRGMKVVAKMPRLVHLDLNRTSIGNDALEFVGKARELRYLNLWGTKVGDDGLRPLIRLSALQSLYVWQTGITENGVRLLSTFLKKARIVRKIELASPAEPRGGNNRRRSAKKKKV